MRMYRHLINAIMRKKKSLFWSNEDSDPWSFY